LKRIFYLNLILFAVLSAIYIGCSSTPGEDIVTDDPEEAFRIAKAKYDHKDYMDAIDDFSFIKVKFPGTNISDRVEYYLGDSYYNKKEYILSAYEFETLLKNYPLSTLIPQARYKLGLCYYQLSPKYSLDQDYTIYAISELQSFVEAYPGDKNVPDAESKLHELRNKLAYKDFRTAEIYMKMDDYKSASIYYNNVYENYIDSDWAEAAMLGHAEALINSYKYNEAGKVLDKFYKLFPNSKLKSQANKLKQQITLD
jgi:outer membrane protein assembly factor BamD